MGSSKSKPRIPHEKLALVIGISDYSQSQQLKSLPNPSQNAYQMSRFLRKHEFVVTSNVSTQEQLMDKSGSAFNYEIIQIIEEFLQKVKKTKNRVCIVVYFSGAVTTQTDTQELCGLDSMGVVVKLQRYCEAFAPYKNVCCVFMVEGVFFKDKPPKPQLSTEKPMFDSSILYMSEQLASKKKQGMCLLYSVFEEAEVAYDMQPFIISRRTHALIHLVNTASPLSLLDIHVLLRDDHLNLGVPDHQWEQWRIFNQLCIQELDFYNGARKYTGEVVQSVMHGYGVYTFVSRCHRYEGEFAEGNFEGYGVYVWQKERQYYEGEWLTGR